MTVVERRWHRLPLLFLFIHSILNNSFTTTTFTTVDAAQKNNIQTTNEQENTIPISKLSIPLFAIHLSHHAYVYIGSPPQRRLVIVDTGSRLLSFPCKPCQKCGRDHVSGSFWDPEISTTDVPNNCEMEECAFRDVFQTCQRNHCVLKQTFAEGSSLTAYELNDLTWLGTENIPQSKGNHMHTAVPFTFGCQVDETGMIKKQLADGILGLSMHGDNLITVMYKERSIEAHAFSLCLKRTGGFMSIGGMHHSSDNGGGGGMHHLKEPVYFERLNDVNSVKLRYYSIRIKSIRINTATLPLSNVSLFFSEGKGTVVDSGTSDTYLPKGIANAFRKVWIQEQGQQGHTTGAGSEHTNRVETYTYEQFKELPNVILTLSGGYEWVIRPSAYMEVAEKSSSTGRQKRIEDNVVDEFVDEWIDEKKLANRIYLDEPIGCVIGANWMFDHDVLFDIGGSRIGIARADCTYRGGV